MESQRIGARRCKITSNVLHEDYIHPRFAMYDQCVSMNYIFLITWGNLSVKHCFSKVPSSKHSVRPTTGAANWILINKKNTHKTANQN